MAFIWLRRPLRKIIFPILLGIAGCAVLIALKDAPAPTAPTEITGTILWPDDKNSSTPAPDLPKNIWFARNVADMAAHLDTAEIMVVASTATPPDTRLTPLPIQSATIKNDHLEYAITWFLLALVWAIMSLYLIFRIRQEDA